VLKPNVNCVTLAAGCSTPQVYNVNWVVPPAWYISQKWWGHVPPSSYGGAALAADRPRSRLQNQFVIGRSLWSSQDLVAVGALEECGIWGWVSPPHGKGAWGGGRAFSEEKFSDFYVKMTCFGAFWHYFGTILSN